MTCIALIQSESIFWHIQFWNKLSSDLHSAATVREHLLTFTVLVQAIFWPAQLWYRLGSSFDLYSSGTSHLLTCTALVLSRSIFWPLQFWYKPSSDLHSSGTVREHLLTYTVLEQAIFWPTQLWYSLDHASFVLYRSIYNRAVRKISCFVTLQLPAGALQEWPLFLALITYNYVIHVWIMKSPMSLNVIHKSNYPNY